MSSASSSTSSTSTTSSPINVVNFLGTAPPMARTYHVYKPHPPSPPPALSLSQSTILVAEDESLTQLSNSVRAAATTGSSDDDADDDRTILMEETREGSTRDTRDTSLITTSTAERTASPPPELSDQEWTEAFAESLGSAQILNAFLGRVPFVVWTSLATSWLMIAVHRFGAASKEEASLEFMVDTPATLEALALISVLRGIGADWPKNMSESDACWWRCRLAGFQEARRIMTHEGKNEAKNYDSSSNGSGSNDGFLHKRARLDDAEEEEGGERTKFP